jgi:hypothetical protein
VPSVGSWWHFLWRLWRAGCRFVAPLLQCNTAVAVSICPTFQFNVSLMSLVVSPVLSPFTPCLQHCPCCFHLPSFRCVGSIHMVSATLPLLLPLAKLLMSWLYPHCVKDTAIALSTCPSLQCDGSIHTVSAPLLLLFPVATCSRACLFYLHCVCNTAIAFQFANHGMSWLYPH